MDSPRDTQMSKVMNVSATYKVSDTWIEHVTFSHNKEYLSASSNTTTYIISVQDPLENQIQSELCHEDIVWKSAFSKNDKTLCTCCADGTFYAWDAVTGVRKCKVEIDEEGKSVFGISVSPDNKTVAVCTMRGFIKLIDLADGSNFTQFKGHNGSVEDVCYSPTGYLLASCAKDGIIKLWSNVSLKRRKSKECVGHFHWVFSCSFSTNEKYIVSASADKTVKLWSTENCQCLKTFSGHKNIVWSAQFLDTADTTVVSCSSDGSIRLWGAESGRCLEILDNPGQHNYSEGFPKDQLFWCVVNHTGGTGLAVSSFYGNIYSVDISSNALRIRNEIELKKFKKDQEKMYQYLAKSVVSNVLTSVNMTMATSDSVEQVATDSEETSSSYSSYLTE